MAHHNMTAARFCARLTTGSSGTAYNPNFEESRAQQPYDSDHGGSQASVCHRLRHPRDDLVEHLVERGRALEAQDLLGLGDIGHPLLDVVLVGGVADEGERRVALDLLPDDIGQLADTG